MDSNSILLIITSNIKCTWSSLKANWRFFYYLANLAINIHVHTGELKILWLCDKGVALRCVRVGCMPRMGELGADLWGDIPPSLSLLAELGGVGGRLSYTSEKGKQIVVKFYSFIGYIYSFPGPKTIHIEYSILIFLSLSFLWKYVNIFFFLPRL